jgi:hypothetical protein
VEVRFAAEPGGTRVDLEHRRFEVSPQMRERGKSLTGGRDSLPAEYLEEANRQQRRQ